MTNEAMLKLVESIDMDKVDGFENIQTIAKIKQGLVDNIRTANNKSSGKANVAKLAKAIIKASSPNQPMMKYAHTENGIQYVLDGHRIAAFEPPIDLPEWDEDKGKWYQVTGLMQRWNTSDMREIEPPDVGELKTQIKIAKAQGYRKCAYAYEDYFTIDAMYLLDFLTGFTNVKCYIRNDDTANVNPMYIVGGEGFGYLLPIRNTNKIGFFGMN